MNRNAIHKTYLLVLAILLAFAGTLHAGKKPDITRHEATLLQNTIKITVEWQAEKPVVLLKATVGGESKEVELDEYDDNTRDRHGFHGEADVSILLEPYEAFVQKDYIPYVIQIRDDLGRKGEIAGRVRVKAQEAEGRYHEAGGGYPAEVPARPDDSGEYKTKHIVRDVLEIVKQHTAQRDKRDHRDSNNMVDTTAPSGSDEVVDSTAPVIELNGENPLTVFVGTPYQEFGAIVKDSQGNTIAGFDRIQALYAKWKWTDEGDADYEYVEKIDTAQAGAYSVLYTYTYDTDKTVEKQRDVDVVDGATPVVTLLPEGNPNVTIEVGKLYKDPGFQAKDKDGKDITQKVKIDGDVDTNSAGTYYLYYDVVDDYGIAAATVYRMVEVVDSTAPGDEVIASPPLGGIGTFGKLPPPGETKGPRKPPSVARMKGMSPPTVSTTQGIPRKLPPGVTSSTAQTKKKARVYYKAKSTPIGSTVNKPTSVKLPPGGISAKQGVTSQPATQPSDDKKKPDVKEMKPLR